MTVLFPVGYGSRLVSITELRRLHEPRMHPVFADRLFRWLADQGGRVGIGGGWRQVNPVRPGFAPPGRSFHESQTFRSGIVGYAAVDLVCVVPGGKHRAPRWDEVPEQGSVWAAQTGLHCNVQTPSEPWHMQPVELDGFVRWLGAGRPDPDPNYFGDEMRAVTPVLLLDTRTGDPVPDHTQLAVPVPAELSPRWVQLRIENIPVTGVSGGHVRVAGTPAGLESSLAYAHTGPAVNVDIVNVEPVGNTVFVQPRFCTPHLRVSLVGTQT